MPLKIEVIPAYFNVYLPKSPLYIDYVPWYDIILDLAVDLLNYDLDGIFIVVFKLYKN